jgi:hypothetical protein
MRTTESQPLTLASLDLGRFAAHRLAVRLAVALASRLDACSQSRHSNHSVNSPAPQPLDLAKPPRAPLGSNTQRAATTRPTSGQRGRTDRKEPHQPSARPPQMQQLHVHMNLQYVANFGPTRGRRRQHRRLAPGASTALALAGYLLARGLLATATAWGGAERLLGGGKPALPKTPQDRAVRTLRGEPLASGSLTYAYTSIARFLDLTQHRHTK